MKRIIPFFPIVLALFCLTASAQTGQYTIRLAEFDVDCDISKYYVDIEIKASSDTSHFNVAHQNYRFSFDETQLGNPQIETELDLSGMVSTSSPATSSLYSAHDLTGSTGNVVSYNVTLDGGEGYPLSHEAFVKVGRISFDLLDPDADIAMNLHTEDSGLFPAIAITKNEGGILPASEGPCYDLFSTSFNVYVFLEGAYDPATGRMSTRLNEYGLLPGQTPNQPSATTTPVGNPFMAEPWEYPNQVLITDYEPTVVDWVLISVRLDSFDTFVSKTPGLLYSDGRVEPLEPMDWNGLPDPLFVSVQTKSHMTVMSATSVSRNCRGATFDFRFQNSYQSTTGYGQIQLAPGVYGMYAGDLDHINANIDNTDNLEFSPQIGGFNYYSNADLNLDGDVNSKDYVLRVKNNGITNWLLENGN